MKFKLGRLVSTCGISELISFDIEFSDFVSDCLKKYTCGDWGDMCKEDSVMNDEAVKSGDGRIHGSYTHQEHRSWKIWIITEWDRSVTTILFPSEY